MDIVWWVLIILFFIGSFVGIFVPFIPDTILLWGGIVIYHFFAAKHPLPVSFWWGMGSLTVLLLAADFLTNLLLVRKYGGSRWGMVASVAGMIVGPFIFGPLGILLGPFLFVLLAEWALKRNLSLASKVAFSSLAAFFGSIGVKIILQAAMIIWFFIVV